jgi:hypothetical protein
MLHRALFGSLERFMGVLLEHSAGKLAPWLAPEQVRVLPVGEQQLACAEALMTDLNAAEVRACLDISSESWPGPSALSLRPPAAAVVVSCSQYCSPQSHTVFTPIRPSPPHAETSGAGWPQVVVREHLLK